MSNLSECFNIIASSQFDPDAITFLTTAGVTDTTQRYAINTLVRSLKDANLWAKIDICYPFVGGTSTSHKFNLKNPVDSNNAFRLTFSGGITHDSNGMRGNGTNAYANTQFNPASVGSTQWDLNNGHFSTYLTATDVSASTGEVLGLRRTISNTSRLSLNPRSNSNLAEFCNQNTTASVDISVGSMLGFQGNTRTDASTIYTVITNGSATSAAHSSQNVPSGATVLLLARHDFDGTNTTVSNYLDATLGFATIGHDAMSGAQLETLRDIVQAFQTTLGRAV